MRDQPSIDDEGPRPPEPGRGRGRFLMRLAIGGMLGAAALLGIGELYRTQGGG